MLKYITLTLAHTYPCPLGVIQAKDLVQSTEQNNQIESSLCAPPLKILLNKQIIFCNEQHANSFYSW